ncbi:GPW/gp25 family protein [Desulfitobacterium chlororespirans]|uniref:IraD/Gp25-like domain-containing protein n=1 Tax=Desulfitobacterium chlororespirans DSM 11544 TaxID=1121395 RepID=A0A1M7U2G4_9FIRM|nr:GPW/gp25 family protein [Desulfitobacterium chlororespirans]SHN77186.1 hypothetical protein SAMN02745215_02853 [Desulfitobacterium chlororespirans DSM 11544]
MQYEIRPLEEIDFGATGAQEVLQNVAFILSTTVSSCPMDRAFGWIPDLDSPIPAAKARSAARVIRAIKENEPRAIVEQVRFEGDLLNGQLKPIVRVSIDESI